MSEEAGIKVNMNIPVQFLKEEGTVIAFSPVLDLSTYGQDFEEAQKRFEEAVEIFLEETLAKGTLIEVLKDLGWSIKDNTINPPVFIGSETKSFEVNQKVDA